MFVIVVMTMIARTIEMGMTAKVGKPRKGSRRAANNYIVDMGSPVPAHDELDTAE